MNKEPTMTLEQVQRTLDGQDCELEAAYRALAEHDREAPLDLPSQALERLHEVCTGRPMASSAPQLVHGVRC
jgi:hypothetical protein